MHHNQLVEGINAFTPQATLAVTQIDLVGPTGGRTPAQINRLTHPSTLLAANDIFWISGWMFAILMAPVWFAGKPPGGQFVRPTEQEDACCRLR